MTLRTSRSAVVKAVLVGSVLIAGLAQAQDAVSWGDGRRTPSKFGGRADPVQFTLVDAYSGEPVANRDVSANRDTGVRCAISPCPSEAEDWKGRTDATGRVAIPVSKLFQETYLSVPTYAGRRIELARETADALTVDLVPDGMTFGTLELQLLDAATGAPLSRVIVGVGNARRSTELVTSPVGYLFIDEDYVFTADAAAVVLRPRGYKTVRYDLMESTSEILRVTRQAGAATGGARPKR